MRERERAVFVGRGRDGRSLQSASEGGVDIVEESRERETERGGRRVEAACSLQVREG